MDAVPPDECSPEPDFESLLLRLTVNVTKVPYLRKPPGFIKSLAVDSVVETDLRDARSTGSPYAGYSGDF